MDTGDFVDQARVKHIYKKFRANEAPEDMILASRLSEASPAPNCGM